MTITIYSKPNCPFCVKSKALVKGLGLTYEEKMFGKDFIKIENDDTLDALKKKTTKLYAQLMTWTSKFPKNNRANTWKDNELAKKKTK